MLRNVVTGIFISFLVSLALVNLNSRLQGKTEMVNHCAITADNSFTTLEDLIRKHLNLSEANQQTQSVCIILPAFHLTGIMPRLTPSWSFSEIIQGLPHVKYITVNLLAFCCRLNI